MNKKKLILSVHLVAIAVLLAVSILIMKINIVEALNAEGEDSFTNIECNSNWRVCLHYVGFEFSIVKIKENTSSGFTYTDVGYPHYRIYTVDDEFTEYELSLEDTTGNLNKIAKGGELFQKIMENTGANNELGDDFYNSSNHYAILMKELFGLLYWDTKQKNPPYKYGSPYCHYYYGKDNKNKNEVVGKCAEEVNKSKTDATIKIMDTRSYSDGAVKGKVLNLLELPEYQNDMGGTMFALTCNIYMPTKNGINICKNLERDKKNIKTALNKGGNEFNAGIVYGKDIKGSLIVTKKYKPGDSSSNSYFNLYSDKDCKKTVMGAWTSKATKKDGFYQGIALIDDLTPKTYYLKELIAPTGYTSYGCTPIKIKRGVNTITVTNKKIEDVKVTVKKLDENNNYLPGANLEIRDANCKNVIKTCGENKSSVCSFTSNSKGNVIKAKLNYGNKYCLVETKAPTGYLISGPVTFVIDDDKITVTMKDEKAAQIKAKKVNSSGELITSDSATFDVYTGYDCNTLYKSGITTKSGILTLGNLKSGDKYSIKETKAPKGYHNKGECVNIQAKTEWKDSNIPKIENPSECEYDFDALKNKDDMLSRINLYITKYKDKNRGLLNLSNKTAEDACAPVKCDNTNNVGCLRVKFGYQGSFDENNLSCYSSDELSQSTGQIMGFCNETFTLDPIGFEAGFNNNFGSVNSGQLYLRRNESNKVIMAGSLTKTCYTFGVKDDEIISFNTNYVRQLSLGNNDLIPSISAKTDTATKIDEFTKRVIERKYNYSLEELYSKRGTGEVGENNNSKSLGYGLASKFSDYGIKSLKFFIKFGNASNTTSKQSTCYYNAIPQLLCPPGKCGDNNSWKIKLAYRQISKSNPFPGKDGTGREVGTNWCDDKNNCANTNTVVTNIITNRNDSYNSTGTGPKYVIDLNSDSIAKIKSEYSNQAYDDFGTNCDNTNGTCASNFIEWMKSQGYMKVN